MLESITWKGKTGKTNEIHTGSLLLHTLSANNAATHQRSVRSAGRGSAEGFWAPGCALLPARGWAVTGTRCPPGLGGSALQGRDADKRRLPAAQKQAQQPASLTVASKG